MTATITAEKTQIATEIRECIKADGAGRVLTATETEVRIQFKTALDATSWVSNYAHADGARFAAMPASFAEPVVVVLQISAYDY